MLNSKGGFKRYFSNEEENELVNWVQEFAANHVCVTFKQFTELVDEGLMTLERAFRGQREETSQKFLDGFVKRHPEIAKTICQEMDRRRKDAANPESVKAFFESKKARERAEVNPHISTTMKQTATSVSSLAEV